MFCTCCNTCSEKGWQSQIRNMPITNIRHRIDKGNIILPGQINALRAAMENKSPIKLKKFEFNEHFKNIVIKNNTAIIKLQEPLPFQLADISQTTISTIESLQTTTPQQLVNIKATVKNISGTKHVKMESGTLNTSSATLVDPTGSITAVFWEEWVNCVELNKTYTFTNFSVLSADLTRGFFVLCLP